MEFLADENAETEWVHALRDDGHDVVRVVDVTRTGGEIRRTVRRIERSIPDLSRQVAYVSDWL